MDMCDVTKGTNTFLKLVTTPLRQVLAPPSDYILFFFPPSKHIEGPARPQLEQEAANTGLIVQLVIF